MKLERWQQIDKLLDAALDRDPAERARFLDEACAGDEALRREVESLISSDRQAYSFIEQPAFEIAAEMLAAGQASLAAGQAIGPYKIVSLLGAGGMGEVYLAQDTRLDRRVAVKFLPLESSADERAKKLLIREAQAAAKLDHPNICGVYEIAEEGSRSYIVMQYIEGETLANRIQGKRLELRDFLDLAVQIADALALAHSQRIIHRDIKPQNVMVTATGQVKVLDFGLAKVIQQTNGLENQIATQSLATEPGAIIGTVPYMSPEQVKGEILDARSDIFSFGVLLYEMASGRQPFVGQSAAETISAILTREPPPVTEFSQEIPARLQTIIKKALAKDKERRYQTISELLSDLKSLKLEVEEIKVKSLLWQVRQPRLAVPLALLVVALCFVAVWYINRNANIRWARQQALPEINNLCEQEKYWGAFGLAEQAEKYIPGDPLLVKLWPVVSTTISMQTTPPGAAIHVRQYTDLAGAWKYLGQSPLNDIKLPRGHVRWRVEKQGYATVEGMWITEQMGPASRFTVPLDEENTVPPGMVHVPGKESWTIGIAGFEELKPAPLTDYWIDKYEVTNKQFKEFIDRGGYQKREYWKEPFSKGGRAITWEEAMLEFRDATGRPGPAVWEQGGYPRGQDDHAVTGISWYEAVAYAEFVGKSLPTLYHWHNAAVAGHSYWLSPPIIALSNFDSQGSAQVGRYQGLGPYGTYDMAGNVKEWCWNEADNRKRCVLGGAWDEPAYMFLDADAQPPLSRSARFGFRCMKYISAEPTAKELTLPIEPLFRNYDEEKPVSDELFQIYRSLYSYDKTALNATTESVDETNENWRKEKITFNAAYGNERVIAYLFLPRKSAPPYQTIVYFPGAYAVYSRSSENQDRRDLGQIDYIIKSGRAVLFPVYKGTFERGDDLKSDLPNTTVFYRDHVISWSKDLGRSIDYLQTRQDIDHDKIGFYGFSWGAEVGPSFMAIEGRIKVSIFVAGGLHFQKALPEVDMINFLPRVKMPVLMVNGRYDFFFPIETSQAPMFRLLGTSQEHKRQAVFESGHSPPRIELIKEVLSWLDQYLGTVRSH